MPTAHITYEGNLRTKSTHLKSGNSVVTDAPVDNHGLGSQFSPTDLVTSALGSCMITIIGIVADKNKIELKSVNADATKRMLDHPRRIGEIETTITIEGDFSDKQKMLLKKAALTCPVAKSLHPDLNQKTNVLFVRC